MITRQTSYILVQLRGELRAKEAIQSPPGTSSWYRARRSCALSAWIGTGAFWFSAARPHRPAGRAGQNTDPLVCKNAPELGLGEDTGVWADGVIDVVDVGLVTLLGAIGP